MTMRAYYEDGSCTIYHADCREILPRLGKVEDIHAGNGKAYMAWLSQDRGRCGKSI